MISSTLWLRARSKFNELEFEQMHWNVGSLETHKYVRILQTQSTLVTAMKSVRIVQEIASDAVR